MSDHCVPWEYAPDPVPSAVDVWDGPPLSDYWCASCDAECEGDGLCSQCMLCEYCERPVPREETRRVEWHEGEPDTTVTLCPQCVAEVPR